MRMFRLCAGELIAIREFVRMHEPPIAIKLITIPLGMLMFGKPAGVAGSQAAVGIKEVDGINIPAVVHIDDGAVVAGDGLLSGSLVALRDQGKAIVVLIVIHCDIAGISTLLHNLDGGELRVVGVLLPVNHGIVGGLTLPLGVYRSIRGDGLAKCKFTTIGINPALECVAGAHRVSSRAYRDHIGSHKFGGEVSTAVGFKLQPVACLHLGVKGDVLINKRNGFDPVRLLGIRIPAGDGLTRCHSKGGIRINGIACCAFSGLNDTAIFIQEEYIVDLLEVGSICIGLPTYKLPCAGEGVPIAVLPAQELIARLFGRGRSYHSCLLALLDGLGGYNCLSILKHIGIHKGFNGLTLIRLN